MAQQHSQYPQREFSPLQRIDSPQGSPYPIDPKRPAFSPTAQSPYGSPRPSNIALPNQVFSGPYYGGQANGAPPHPSTFNAHSPYSPHHTFNTLNTYPPLPSPATATPLNTPTGTMGPPSRPLERPPERSAERAPDKPTDINDLGDVLLGSGIDLKEEEAAMYGNRSQQPQSTPSPYPFPRDNYYTSNTPGDRQSFYGSGFFNQPSKPYQSVEELADLERTKAIRRKAEIRQYHLNDPFLQTGNLQTKFETERRKHQVTFDDSGFLLARPPFTPHEARIVGPDGNEVIKILQDEIILQKDAAQVEILALISLAAQERLRILIEDAAVLAKQRQVGALGIAPKQFLALSEGKEGDASNVLPTLGESAVAGKAGVLKREITVANAILQVLTHYHRLLCRIQ